MIFFYSHQLNKLIYEFSFQTLNARRAYTPSLRVLHENKKHTTQCERKTQTSKIMLFLFMWKHTAQGKPQALDARWRVAWREKNGNRWIKAPLNDPRVLYLFMWKLTAQEEVTREGQLQHEIMKLQEEGNLSLRQQPADVQSALKRETNWKIEDLWKVERDARWNCKPA